MAKKVHIHTQINGQEIEFLCEPRQTLLEVLREGLGLIGTKEGCSNGNCGACSVLLDGVLVNACLVLAVEVRDKSVTTIEGLASQHGLHPIQEEFLAQGAVQCGFCTPGMIMGTKSLLDHIPQPSESEIRYWLAGNLCRCTGYDKIVRAVQAAADRMASVEG
jgi:carbon-monoxide dehydrogenase small subunit